VRPTYGEPMPITLIENFRAAFYAPFYAAIALEAYDDEGVDVRVEPSPDAERTMQTLISGGGDVSWGGPLRLMKAREPRPAHEPVVFCEVVGRDPFFLVGREPNTQFAFAELAGKRLAVTTEVPTPWLCLQHDLTLAGLDAAAISLAPSRTMAENAAALHAGEVDVIQVFMPIAESLVESGAGHIWYAAADRGPTAYTSLNTTRQFADAHPDVLLAMCRAMYRTQKWIASHDGRALAEAIGSWLPDIPSKTLAAAYDRYLSLGLWNTNPVQSRSGLEWLRDAGLGGGYLTQAHRYEDVVDMRFAEAALREDPPSM
jgi:NitT/TauT family transport system substrate-binding protein